MSEEKDEDARNPACLYDQYFSTPMVVIKKKKNFSSDVLSTVRHHHPVPTDRPEYKQFLDFSVMLVVKISSITTGCFKKNFTLLGNQTLGTSYSETTNLIDLKLW